MINTIKEKVFNNGRLNREEGLWLLKNGSLLDLAEMAEHRRYVHNPNPKVTFVVDTNPNYTNICNVDCIFCAFYRHEGEEGEYSYTVDQMVENFKRSAANGVTTILLQGGVNPKIPFEYYCEMVERTVKEVPGVTPHFWSTS